MCEMGVHISYSHVADVVAFCLPSVCIGRSCFYAGAKKEGFNKVLKQENSVPPPPWKISSVVQWLDLCHVYLRKKYILQDICMQISQNDI